MFNLWIKNCLFVENLFLILLKEGDGESAAPPLMPSESETKRNGFIITSSFVDLKTMNSYRLPGKYLHLTPQRFQKYKTKNLNFWNPLSKVSIWGPRGEVSARRKRRRTWRGSGRLLIWCCSRRPSDGACNSHQGRPQNCPFPGLSNLFRGKIFLDEGHRRPKMLLFQFWIPTGSVGWRNDTGCQWWSSFGSFWWMVLEEIESLSKTTKLLLLDSLLQEVCIESGSDGSLSLSSLGMSVCLVSHNLLYSGLKKAHSKKISVGKRKKLMFLNVLSSKVPCKRNCFLLAGSSLIWVGEKDNLLGIYASTSPKMVTESHQCPVWVSACRERRGTRKGSRRLLVWCCSRPPSDGTANSHLGKPQKCPFLGLSNLLISRYFWIRVIGGQQCCCFNFGSWQGRLDEEMTVDVSDGPGLGRFDGWH